MFDFCCHTIWQHVREQKMHISFIQLCDLWLVAGLLDQWQWPSGGGDLHHTHTTAIRETGSIERHGAALVSLWESCLEHNLQPQGKDEDTPHAKIASDITSCILQVRATLRAHKWPWMITLHLYTTADSLQYYSGYSWFKKCSCNQT